LIREYGPDMGHLLHAQPWDIRRWTYTEFYDRMGWVDAYRKAMTSKG
jgi:hypothetical protein